MIYIHNRLKAFKGRFGTLIDRFVTYPRLQPSNYSFRLFHQARNHMQIVYDSILSEKANEIITERSWCHPYWEEERKQLGEYINSGITEGFLSHSSLSRNMSRDVFGSEERRSLAIVQTMSGSFAKFLDSFRDSRVGLPNIRCKELRCSVPTLGCLTYLARMVEMWNIVDRDNIRSIVEFGGGYGNLAHVIWMAMCNKNITYIILDLPELIALQYLFLTLNFSESLVHVCSMQSPAIEVGKINLVPIHLLDKLDILGDLFVATFSLTEATSSLQRYIFKEKHLFGAKYIYMTGGTSGVFDSRGDFLSLARAHLPNFLISQWVYPHCFELSWPSPWME